MLEQFYRLDEVAGVAIHLRADGGLLIDACSIQIKKNQLSFEKKLTGIASLKELQQKLPDKLPLALNLTGKGVLSKQLDQLTEITESNFSAVLPNARFEDFYLQQFQSGNQLFVSVIRKQDADGWVEQFKALGWQLLMISLDGFPLQQILPQLNVYDTDVELNGHCIQRNEQQQWLSYKKKPATALTFTLKAGNETLPQEVTLPYAVAFQLAMGHQIAPIAIDSTVLAAALCELQANRKFKAQGAVVLMYFFILLLANFLVFNAKNSANNELSSRIGELAQATTGRDTLEKHIANLEAQLQQLGIEQPMRRKSILIDQLASLVPEGVTWTETTVAPLDEAASRNTKTMVFSNHLIRISGSSAQVIPVNEWMARIKTRHWVKDVQMLNYSYNHEKNTGMFTIAINY